MTGCAVQHARCVGLDEDGFDLYVAGEPGEWHFCKVHALAAEALVTFSGCKGAMVADLLRLLELRR